MLELVIIVLVVRLILECSDGPSNGVPRNIVGPTERPLYAIGKGGRT